MTGPSSPVGEAVHKSVLRATKEDFRAWLRKGLGRAAILLRDKPDDPDLNAVLLDACIEDWTYDSQCEAGRAPYLFGLIRITGRAAAYRAELEARLKAAASGEANCSVAQVFGVLCRFAEQDDSDQTMLRNFVLATENRALAMDGVDELVRLQGFDALLACIHRFHPEFTEEPWMLAGIMHELKKRDGAAAVASALAQARRDDPELDRLIRLTEAPTKNDQSPVTTLTYEILRTELQDGARYRFPAAWVKGASLTEIERVAEDLLAEPDETRMRPYLAVFVHRDFPGDPTRLFPLLASVNKRVAVVGANALARLSNPIVRRFGLKLIADGQPALGFRVLRNSYRDDDLLLLRSELNRHAADPDTYHHVSGPALDLIRDMTAPSDVARAILLDMYEDGPCSLCRGTVVDLLADMDGMPDWMSTEGCYDAEPSIVERFAR